MPYDAYSMSRAWWEGVVLLVAVIVLLGWFGFVVAYNRAAVRDDLRQTDLALLKHALEQYYNLRNRYVTPPSHQAECTSSADPNSWLFGSSSPLLHDRLIDAIPHDVREGQRFAYHYCVTSLGLEDEEAPGKKLADGYFLEARLEQDRPDEIGFDEDEQRKYHYRVLHEGNTVLYRVCGGVERQCESAEVQ
jgi:hypothetical protein